MNKLFFIDKFHKLQQLDEFADLIYHIRSVPIPSIASRTETHAAFLKQLASVKEELKELGLFAVYQSSIANYHEGPLCRWCKKTTMQLDVRNRRFFCGPCVTNSPVFPESCLTKSNNPNMHRIREWFCSTYGRALE
jgi:hypothetical protein